MPFGEILQELMRERHVSVAELSRRTGINKNTLYSYFRRNTRRPDPAILGPIAEALDVPLNQLLGVGEPIERPKEDDDLWELREAFRRNPEMRTLFSISKSATQDQLRQTIAIIEALKKSNEHSEH